MLTQTNTKSVWDGPDRKFRILRRLALESISGLGAAFIAAPIIMMIDKAVVQKASGTFTIMASLKETSLTLIKNPIKFIFKKEFMWIWFVYGSTYMTANSIDSLCKINHYNDVLPKLIGITAVNMTASILKDRAFAYYYGQKSSSRVGMISMLIWMVRDVLTIAGGFVLPSKLSYLFQKTGLEDSTAKKITQFTVPITSQILLTPIHLMGYDHYNFPGRTLGQRVAYIKGIYPSTLGIRMMRMGTAYGIGGINNQSFRNSLISRFEGKNWNTSYS